MKTHIFLHHSAIMGNERQIDRIDASHKARGFPRGSMGYYCGYNIVIEKDGHKIRTRRDSEDGAHTFGHNEEGLGVCLAGNFKHEKPTKQQLHSLRKVTEMWQRNHDIPDENVKLHWEVRPTACPGVDLRYLMRTQNRHTRPSRVRRMSERVLSRLLTRLSRRGDKKRFWRVKKHADT